MTFTVFRLGKQAYRDQLFSGQGGLYASGRWTPRGRPVVYTSASISLAVLEYTANYRRRGWVPATVLGRAVIPASVRVETVSIEKLPGNWFAAPSPRQLQTLGKRVAGARRNCGIESTLGNRDRRMELFD